MQTSGCKLTIFVHRASECLTDHESHGDGLICFSLLNGLAERGHHIYAYTNRAPIQVCHPNLVVRIAQHRIPANSLANWEHAWRADRWLQELLRGKPIDLVWRMHPYGTGCPVPPKTYGRPLVIGPMFYEWPNVPANRSTAGKPRFGVGIQPLLQPVANRGWEKALQRADLLICATEPHSSAICQQVAGANVLTLPVIVGLTAEKLTFKRRFANVSKLNLIFVANILPNKHPQMFCEMVGLLRTQGLDVSGTLLGDGRERESVQAYCQENGLQDVVLFAGKVPNAEVYARMKQADALVSLSLGEPYGRSIVEAMSVGTPAICHWSGGPADFITNCENGLLVDNLTPEAYAQTVHKLFDTQGLWDMISKNAIHTSEQWRSEIVLNHLEQALLSVAEKKKSN